MPARLYIVPVVGVGTKASPRAAKYFSDGTIPASAYGAMDYGFEPWMVVGANLPATDDITVAGEPDALALPFDLTTNLTAAQVTTTQTKLEAINVPAGWVNTGLTWTQVVKSVLGGFSIWQRFGGIYAKQNGTVPPSVFTGGITLDSTFGSLPLAVRTALISTASSFSIDTSGLTGASTIRVIWKSLSDDLQSMSFTIGPVHLA